MDKKKLNAMLERMHDALDAMDEVALGEGAEELCAETEDLLFFIESVDPNDEDAEEEVQDTLEELIEALDDASTEGLFAEKVSIMRNRCEFAKLNL